MKVMSVDVRRVTLETQQIEAIAQVTYRGKLGPFTSLENSIPRIIVRCNHCIHICSLLYMRLLFNIDFISVRTLFP